MNIVTTFVKMSEGIRNTVFYFPSKNIPCVGNFSHALQNTGLIYDPT